MSDRQTAPSVIKLFDFSISKISAEALNNGIFREITSTYKHEAESSDTKRIMVNHNKMLKSYDGCIGVKTGYTTRSGRCLVSAAEKDGLTMISVTIDAPDDWRDHTEMLDYGYSALEKRILADIGEFSYEIPVLAGKENYVRISNTEKLEKIFNKNDTNTENHVKLSRYFSAPISKGDILGTVIFTKDGKEIATLPLRAEKSVQATANKKRFFNI